ncbi:MAG: hypothetical protein JW832_18205 [Deltaproteobacteria bacterium]|nr:hypothetical protein [Deltaproteobacteria bacterium]
MIKIVNDELLIVKLSGICDARALDMLGKELNEIERTKTYVKRLVDVDDLQGVTATSNDIMFYKKCRFEPAEKTATALCVRNDFQYGMARMFQSLVETDRHEIAIFRDIESAAHWLQVDSALLKKDKHFAADGFVRCR